MASLKMREVTRNWRKKHRSASLILVHHLIQDGGDDTDDFADYVDDTDDVDDNDDDDQRPGGAPLVGVPGAVEEGAHVGLSSPSHIHHQYSCKEVFMRGQGNIS